MEGSRQNLTGLGRSPYRICHPGGSATTDRVHALQVLTGSFTIFVVLDDAIKAVQGDPGWFDKLTNLSPG